MGGARNFAVREQRGGRANGIAGQNRAYVLGASSYIGTCGGGNSLGQGLGHGGAAAPSSAPASAANETRPCTVVLSVVI